MNRKRMEEVFRGDYGQEPHGSWTRTTGYHVIQGCNVNMQFGGATSRDVARQADQYGLSLALLHQDAKLLHHLPSFRTFALRLTSEGGCQDQPTRRVLTFAP